MEVQQVLDLIDDQSTPRRVEDLIGASLHVVAYASVPPAEPNDISAKDLLAAGALSGRAVPPQAIERLLGPGADRQWAMSALKTVPNACIELAGHAALDTAAECLADLTAIVADGRFAELLLATKRPGLVGWRPAAAESAILRRANTEFTRVTVYWRELRRLLADRHVVIGVDRAIDRCVPMAQSLVAASRVHFLELVLSSWEATCKEA